MKIHLFSLLHLSIFCFLCSVFLPLDLSYHFCQQFPKVKLPPGSVIYQEDSQYSTYGHSYDCDLLQQKHIKKICHREKAHWVYSGRASYKLQIILLRCSHIRCTCFFPTDCDNICAMLYTREAHYRPSPQDFYWRLSAQHIPNFSFSEGKQLFQHQPFDLYKQFRLVSHSNQLRNGGNPPKFKFPDASLEPTLQAGIFQYSSLRPVLLTLLCIPFNVISCFFSEGFLLVLLIEQIC